jgi:hypothetical protein
MGEAGGSHRHGVPSRSPAACRYANGETDLRP